MGFLCGIYCKALIIFALVLCDHKEDQICFWFIKLIFCISYKFQLEPNPQSKHNQTPLKNVHVYVSSPARSYQNNEHMNDWGAGDHGDDVDVVTGSYSPFGVFITLNVVQ